MHTICVRVAAMRAVQNALEGRMRPAGRSLPTSGLNLLMKTSQIWFFLLHERP